MTFPLIDNLLIISSFVTAILASLLLIKTREISSKFLAMASYGATFWILASLFFRHINGPWLITIARMQYVAGIIILSFFIFFAYSFLNFDIKKNKKLIIIISLLSVFFMGLTLFTDLIIQSVKTADGIRIMTYGWPYYLYTAYIIVVALLSFYYLVSKFKGLKNKLSRLQLTHICIGTNVSLAVGIVTDIILPIFGIFSLLWLGPIMTTFFVILATYVVLRHHLFDIRVVAAELLIVAILTALFVQILTAAGPKDMILKTAFFVVVSILSNFLLRSIYKEIKQRRRIEKLAKRLSSFVSFTTHELRRPIAKLKGILSTMLDEDFGRLPAETREWVQRSFDLTREMNQDIETFLSLNKLQTGQLELVKQEVDIRGITIKCLDSFAADIKHKNITLDFKKDAKIPPVAIDKFQIRHVISNLISNAIKFTPTGGRIKIYVKTDQLKENLIFSIKDTGIGIPPHVLPHLFNQYERGDKDVKLSFVGSGIGLYLARKLIRLHDGQIRVESRGKNNGCTFSFSLPLNQ